MKLSKSLTPEYLAQLNKISYDINRKIHSKNSGMRRSTGKGISLEFSDYKHYNPGDDIKHIDWNVYARSQRLFVKLFMEERSAAVNIFIDTSKSMEYGLYKKIDYAKLLAASICYTALKNGDSINIYACSDKSSEALTDIYSKNSFKKCVDFIESISLAGSNFCSYFDTTPKLKNGISFILSDFYEYESLDSLRRLQYMKQDISLVQILSPEELEPELSGNLRLTDIENGAARDITINDKVINSYKKALKNMEIKITSFCSNYGLSYNLISTDISIIRAVLKIL